MKCKAIVDIRFSNVKMNNILFLYIFYFQGSPIQKNIEYIANGQSTNKNITVAECVSGFHLKVTEEYEFGMNSAVDLKQKNPAISPAVAIIQLPQNRK